MKTKHNKKRNTGLLYEFLTRDIAEALVENDKRRVKQNIKILKKFFKEGTELNRELRLFKALLGTYVSSKQTAQRIIEATAKGSKTYDNVQLDREKSLLIRVINHTFNNEKFYDRHVNEYRLYATVQMLLNEWRRDLPSDVVQTALHEEELIEHLTTPKDDNVLEESRDIVDDLVVNLMLKKVNGKYSGLLNDEQISLINKFVESKKANDSSDIRESLESLRLEALAIIENIEKKRDIDETLFKRLSSVKNLLSESVSNVDDHVFARYLRVARFKQEFAGE